MLLDTPCTAGEHGSVEHIISVWIHSRPVSNGDSFQSVFSRMPSLSHQKSHFWAHFSSWRHQRQFNTMWFWHPFPKVKVTWPLFALFPKNATFFRPKKGPRTGRYQSLTQLTAIQFSDHSKSKAQTTSRQEPWSTLQMSLEKSIIFRTNAKERSRSRTSVFLHYRTDRALRAKNVYCCCFAKYVVDLRHSELPPFWATMKTGYTNFQKEVAGALESGQIDISGWT